MAGDEAKHVGVRNAITNLLRVWPAYEQRVRGEVDTSEISGHVWALSRAFERANNEESRKLAMRYGNELKSKLDSMTPPTKRGLTFTLGLLVEEGVKNGNMTGASAAELVSELEAVFDRAFPRDGKPFAYPLHVTDTKQGFEIVDADGIEHDSGTRLLPGSVADEIATMRKVYGDGTRYRVTRKGEGIEQRFKVEPTRVPIPHYGSEVVQELEERALRKREPVLDAAEIRSRLARACFDNTPGNQVEDRRVDALIDALAILLAEIVTR